jgi:hypothetical protein
MPSNPDASYTDNGDGTVTHTPTGLTWKRCVEGQTWSDGTCTGTATTATWQQALKLAAASSFAGHTDWRLPNIKELRSLVEECRSYPAINEAIFPNTQAKNPSVIVPLWSGSPLDSTGRFKEALTVEIQSFGHPTVSPRLNLFNVRLMRVGAPSSTPPLSDVNCFLDWAESQLPHVMSPPHQTTQLLQGTAISYRFYPNSGAFIGVDGASNAVLSMGGVLGQAQNNHGLLSHFLPAARAVSCK